MRLFSTSQIFCLHSKIVCIASLIILSTFNILCTLPEILCPSFLNSVQHLYICLHSRYYVHLFYIISNFYIQMVVIAVTVSHTGTSRRYWRRTLIISFLLMLHRADSKSSMFLMVLCQRFPGSLQTSIVFGRYLSEASLQRYTFDSYNL